MRIKLVALNAVIDELKRIQDWPKLEEAIEEKIGEQERFVAEPKAALQVAEN